MDIIGYLSLGFIIGGIGTLIGAGGGFILVPLLFYLYPNMLPHKITALSLFAVACNATSGSLTYWAKKQIHLQSAIYFTIASIPGSILGTIVVDYIERRFFILFFAFFIFLLGIFLFRKKTIQKEEADNDFSIDQKRLFFGIIISFFVGFVSTILGIGGGIIHVPLLAEVLKYPVHLATGTSHFILSITTIIATLFNFFNEDLIFFGSNIIPIAFGMLVGAQVGAKYSKNVKGETILKILGMVLILVSFRLVYSFLLF